MQPTILQFAYTVKKCLAPCVITRCYKDTIQELDHFGA